MSNFKLKLDVSKLDRSAFFHGKNGAIYCDLVIWENRDGEDNYGNTHSVKQDFGKDKGPERPPYVGNMKPFGGGGQRNAQGGRDRTPADSYRPGTRGHQEQQRAEGYENDPESEIPF